MREDVQARVGLTFGQAEGLDALPRQLAAGEISRELTAVLWAITHESLKESKGYDTIGYGTLPWMNPPWKAILYSWFVTQEWGLADEFTSNWETLTSGVKGILTSGNYVKVFNFLQFVIARPDCPRGFASDVAKTLERTRSAYRVVDKYIVPLSTGEEAGAVEKVFAIAAQAKAQGPRTHLRNASAELTAGDWPGAVRESIHAVEAAAKLIEQTADTLGPALAKLQTSIGLNPILKSAFGQLYGYSCKDGARHALVFEAESTISERDALFMFGACAAFVGYLLSATPMVAK